MTRSSSLLCLLSLLAWSSGCGGDDAGSSQPSLDASVSLVDASPDADDDDTSDEDDDVPCTADFPDFMQGMTTKSGDLTIKLLSISPAPPRQLIPNNWVIEIDNADGTPATGALVGSADSYMPVHRHHGLTPPTVAVGTTPGQVQINAINFRMRGPWQVNFNVTPVGGTAKIATFQICVQ